MAPVREAAVAAPAGCRALVASYETAVKPLQKRYPNVKHCRINPDPEVCFEMPAPEKPAVKTQTWKT